MTANATSLRRWLPFIAVIAAYLVVATQQITLPGVYMDAVNPDYLVVRLLNPHPADVVGWALQGNLLFGGRVPVLIAVYHGSHTFWLGLPLYWLLGTTVTSLRIVHAVFALGVLAGLYTLLQRGGLRPWQAALACVALAIDASFSYAFRTQSYITLAPSAWFLFGLSLMLPPVDAARSSRWFWSGVLVGLAIASYFIYAFFLPVIIALAVARLLGAGIERSLRWRRVRQWVLGVALGASPYVVGYALAARYTWGTLGFVDFFRQQTSVLNAFGSQVSPVGRFVYAWQMVEGCAQNAWHHSMMFGQWTPVPGATAKTILLIGAPALLWILAEWRRRATPLQRVAIALPVSFFLCALGFGNRLGGHHFIVLIPLLYAALACGLVNALPRDATVRWRAAVFVVPLLGLSCLNVAGQVAEARTLAATRGVGLFSDAITRLADDLNATEIKPQVYFPDWGLALPITFLTHGDVPLDTIVDYAKATRILCSGRDVAVAFMEGDRAARSAEWQSALHWDAPVVTPYRQADGNVVFDYVLFRGRRDGPGCDTAGTQ